jgi:hypothetical protein
MKCRQQISQSLIETVKVRKRGLSAAIVARGDRVEDSEVLRQE